MLGLRVRREARRHGNFYLEAEPKIALVVRIRGINDLSPKVKKILQLLRLHRVNSATFVRLSSATIKLLRLVEPYVTYGPPNLKTVRQLLYKRGFAKARSGERLPIVDNAVIEKALGRYDIICMEDLVHEIFTIGPHFKECNKFLWPFHLNPPKGGYSYVKKHYVEGGDAGNRETAINALVQRMV